MFNFDEHFLSKIQARDRQAFEIFYEMSVDGFYRFLCSQTSLSEADRQDFLADFFVKLRDNLRKFDEKKWSFETFCRTMFRNLLKDKRKKKSSLNFSELRSDDGPEFEDTLVDEGDLLDLFEQEFQRDTIFAAMESLSFDEKEIIFLKFIEEKSNTEIAKTLGIREDTARQRLSRTLKNLRTRLQNPDSDPDKK